jgi:DNA-binding winged helix-turn-helix (wHTH) protein/tetratricopeptide (TPR) repeat protein
LVVVSATQELLRFGIFELNLATEELRKSGTPVKLPPLPFKLLALLASHAGQIVTRQEIQEKLWGAETFVDFEQGVNKCIKQIRTALNDNADNPLYIETLPRHGYRFLAPVVSKTIAAPGPRVVESPSGELPHLPVLIGGRAATPALARALAPSYPVAVPDAEARVEPRREAADIRQSRLRHWRTPLIWIGSPFVLVGLIAAGLYLHEHIAIIHFKATEKDPIVLADFDNKTGDPVFDDTLKQELAIQLEQLPFLNVLSDLKVAETLKLMNRSGSERLTEDVAHEVCLRTNSKAMLTGSIAGSGSQYVIGVKAVDCNTGDQIADAQEQAVGKENVLKALDRAAAHLLGKLGQSLASAQKYRAPLEEATTPSLEALQAYTLGYQAVLKLDSAAATQFFQQAIDRDPSFAMAYARLGEIYANLGETARARDNLSKAYELRARVGEREKLYIDSHYEDTVTGNLEAARRAYESWAQMYPRDEVPLDNLGNLYFEVGQHNLALATFQKLHELDPGSELSSGGLVTAYTFLDRLEEAEAMARQAQAHGADSPSIHTNLYQIDFLKHDSAGMDQEAALILGKPGDEDDLLYLESDTAAYAGQLAKARELTRRAVASAQHADTKEDAAAYEAAGAVREALVGNPALAKQRAKAALALSKGRDVQAISTVALTLAGDSRLAMRLANDLAARFPNDTLVQFNYLPVIHAGAALESGNSAKALEALAPAAPYELGVITGSADFTLYPIYLRGEAYLAAHQGAEAAVEFQKILDHPGIASNEPIGALAHLGLGRAYALSGNTAKSTASYRDFLTLWKDADPDVPVYRQAKAEYAKLQ